MIRAIGVIEYKTVSTGVFAADLMVKTADVKIIESQTVCPGKYMIIITGELSAVNSAIDKAKKQCENQLISSFVLGNPHNSIFPAIYGASDIEEISSLGILETYDIASMLVAADEAAKTAIVQIIEIRLARGMCGKSYMFLSGEISAVETAIARAKLVVAIEGMYLDSCIISNPDDQIRNAIL